MLRSAGTGAVFDVIGLLDDSHVARLASYATGAADRPSPGFWTAADLAR